MRISKKHAIEINASKNIAIVKRFKVIALIALGLFLLNYLTVNDSQGFSTRNDFLCFVVWGWWFIDYKMLPINKCYLGALIIALAILLYGYFIGQKYHFSNEVDLRISIMPILFLAIQKPLRFIFKAIMKREPVIEKPPPTIADFIYTFILWMAPILSVIAER